MSYASPERSFAKSITWRICATLTTVLLVWIFIGKLSIACSVGIVEVVVKLVVYYLHERAWNRVEWGHYKTTPERHRVTEISSLSHQEDSQSQSLNLRFLN